MTLRTPHRQDWTCGGSDDTLCNAGHEEPFHRLRAVRAYYDEIDMFLIRVFNYGLGRMVRG